MGSQPPRSILKMGTDSFNTSQKSFNNTVDTGFQRGLVRPNAYENQARTDLNNTFERESPHGIHTPGFQNSNVMPNGISRQTAEPRLRGVASFNSYDWHDDTWSDSVHDNTQIRGGLRNVHFEGDAFRASQV